VEEQFYILYPPVLALVWRFARKRLRAILLVGGLISLALSAWAVRAWPEGAFYLAPFRAFELLIGAGLATIATAPRLPGWLREGLAAAGLALIAASVLLLNRNSPFPGVLALLPCGGAALIIFTGQAGRTLVGRALSLPFLTFFGAISYSLYLWHWPFLAFGRHFFRAELTPVQIAVLLLGALAAAMMSWLWIERPFLKRARPLPVLRLGGTIMASGAAAAGAVLAGGQSLVRGRRRLQSPARALSQWRSRCDAVRGELRLWRRGRAAGRRGLGR
jgi:peptidoglycan/LPS O-acetylase OafA/YrhL